MIPVSLNDEHLNCGLILISVFSILKLPVHPLSWSKVIIGIIVVFGIKLLPK